jgi:hypothetical protein
MKKSMACADAQSTEIGHNNCARARVFRRIMRCPAFQPHGSSTHCVEPSSSSSLSASTGAGLLRRRDCVTVDRILGEYVESPAESDAVREGPAQECMGSIQSGDHCMFFCKLKNVGHVKKWVRFKGFRPVRGSKIVPHLWSQLWLQRSAVRRSPCRQIWTYRPGP